MEIVVPIDGISPESKISFKLGTSVFTIKTVMPVFAMPSALLSLDTIPESTNQKVHKKEMTITASDVVLIRSTRLCNLLIFQSIIYIYITKQLGTWIGGR
jgi:hypothetical protein